MEHSTFLAVSTDFEVCSVGTSARPALIIVMLLLLLLLLLFYIPCYTTRSAGTVLITPDVFCVKGLGMTRDIVALHPRLNTERWNHYRLQCFDNYFGTKPVCAATIWNLLQQSSWMRTIRSLQPEHLLWTLHFLKWGTKEKDSRYSHFFLSCTNMNEYRKLVWCCVKAIVRLEPQLPVSDYLISILF